MDISSDRKSAENDDEDLSETLYGYEYNPEDEYEDENDTAYNEFSVLGTYDGQRNSKGDRHGFGKTILPNGDAYVGTYKNGLRHGYGLYKFKNGAKYQGCYRNGLRNGKGVMHYPDKSKYEGHWSENKKDGEGVYKYGNGDEFCGSWKSDGKHGMGTYTFCETGAVLKGMWFDDKKIKNLQIFFSTGTGSGFTFHGTWDSDESITGEGYFVFDNLKCMQRGVHVRNPLYKNGKPSEQLLSNKNSCLWFSNRILPVVSGVLPRLPTKRPTIPRRRSSCDIDFPVSSPTNVAASTCSLERLETYEHRDDLWNSTDDLETGQIWNELETEQ